jgi:hypothetical protein
MKWFPYLDIGPRHGVGEDRSLQLQAHSQLKRTKSEYRATLLPMATRPKLTPVQVLQRLQTRLERRMEALQRVKLAGTNL